MDDQSKRLPDKESVGEPDEKEPKQAPEIKPAPGERVEIPARPVEVPEVSRPVAEEEKPIQNDEAIYAYHWTYADQKRHEEDAERKRRRKGTRTYAIVMTVAFAVSLLLLIGVLIMDDVVDFMSERVVYVRELDEDSGVLTVQEIAELGRRYTVGISVTLDKGNSVGSGIIMDAEGHIATNYHVVDGAIEIEVLLFDNKTYKAEYIGGDELSDLAVIKIRANGLTVAEFGNSDDLLVGDPVVAIGTPAGIEYAGTTTNGIISAINRSVKLYNTDGTLSKKMTLIQTNTSVNPGNSGGPLIDEYGRVIGVVSMKLSSGYENIGFAIPSNGALTILNEIVETGSFSGGGVVASKRPLLGIVGVGVDAGVDYVVPAEGEQLYRATIESDGTVKIVDSLGRLYTPEELELSDYTIYHATLTGVWVTSVDETKGAHGKIAVNDVILQVDGKSVNDIYDVMAIINEHDAGDTVVIEYSRDGKNGRAEIVLSSE